VFRFLGVDPRVEYVDLRAVILELAHHVRHLELRRSGQFSLKVSPITRTFEPLARIFLPAMSFTTWPAT
jgi:hypothetical protein